VTRILVTRSLGLRDYEPVWRAMRAFTDSRSADTPSELWLLQHPPVFTLGQAGKTEHLLAPGTIPVLKSDRGGQVTYHGPGQLVAYLLLDLRQAGVGVRALVRKIEAAVIDLLADYDIRAESRHEAPGVYVDDAKIAALGLRIRRGYSYHGLSLNVDMDLEPFSRINPCGYSGLAVTSMKALGVCAPLSEIETLLTANFCRQLGYTAQLGINSLPTE
jgi:lipoyl(octanoyl) transferase